MKIKSFLRAFILMLSMLFIGCDEEDIAVQGAFHAALSPTYHAETTISLAQDGTYEYQECSVSG